jgi:hypothetical protein
MLSSLPWRRASWTLPHNRLDGSAEALARAVADAPGGKPQMAIINSIRAHLTEFWIVAPVRAPGVQQLLKVVADVDDAPPRHV